MAISLEKKFNPEIIAEATEAMVKLVYENNPQALDDFLNNLECKKPKELEILTTPLDKLRYIAEDFDIPNDVWSHYYNKSALALLRADIEYRKASGIKADSILSTRQNLLE